MNTDTGAGVAPEQEFCDMFDHVWTDHYYGHECAKCGMFVAFGCEPWMPVSDYDTDEHAEWEDYCYDE
jgi:hypothetical protein